MDLYTRIIENALLNCQNKIENKWSLCVRSNFTIHIYFKKSIFIYVRENITWIKQVTIIFPQLSCPKNYVS